jgi:hypothetical protein
LKTYPKRSGKPIVTWQNERIVSDAKIGRGKGEGKRGKRGRAIRIGNNRTRTCTFFTLWIQVREREIIEDKIEKVLYRVKFSL